MKQTYIWGVIGIIVVAGLGYYAWSSNETTGGITMIGEAFERDAIDDLIGGDKAYVCDVQSAVENRESLGMVYLDGNSFRAEFKTFVPEINTTIDIYSIWDGDYVYSWSSLSPVGSKAQVVREQITFNNASADAADQVIYSCNEVASDPSMIAIPENITFEELAVEPIEGDASVETEMPAEDSINQEEMEVIES
ncbi:MAG: hypothetical protein COV34_02735 [Candidatus Zambryskibacteria bacterium CG10_big_fil_rev_8_21_14_0_10_42_12]|uniref:Uncharacterized protein n=1 Tax=Candidatus Zambryskibacteria bacterium CG10_big_fil_rev_8_21_14_0_10_42_12 TaxID=1975115 RepID=A0A2H0QUM1_9BACT|nr:MAG: hypothetical protein COV34_02735 [Candidatus Zambryskibacteria bacterium CG10_big_fil_rev_8_21_14_0_10_42_12]